MVTSIALAGLTLRSGLRMRRARRLRLPGRASLRRRHLRLAKPALALLVVGFASGPVSAVWLRGYEAFGTAHAWTSSGALLLFLGTGLLGWRLEHGRSRAREVHAALGVLSLLGAAAAFGTGFVLLP